MKSNQKNQSRSASALAATENLIAIPDSTEYARDVKTSRIGMKEAKNTTEKLKMLHDDIEFLNMIITNRLKKH